MGDFLSKSDPVLVTGAAGYVASWVVKNLLESGYHVIGTVRSLASKDKYAHLEALPVGEGGCLELVEADLLKPGSFDEAASKAKVVIRTASPFQVNGIKDPQKELVDPALLGTENVLKAASASPSVKRVVLTSSVASIFGDNIDCHKAGGILSEENWNESSSLVHQPYSYSKTVAEKAAWKMYESQKGWDLVVINPGFILGPGLSQRGDSMSTGFIKDYMVGQFSRGVPDIEFGFCDVRDVAKAHVLGAEKAEVKGRHIIVADHFKMIDISKILKNEFGDKFPKMPKRVMPTWLLYAFGPLKGFSWRKIRGNIGYPLKLDNSRSKKDLGMSYGPLEKAVVDQAHKLIEDKLVRM